MKQRIFITTSGIKNLLEQNGYIITSVGIEVIITKGSVRIASVERELVEDNLLRTSNTLKLFGRRLDTYNIRIDNINCFSENKKKQQLLKIVKEERKVDKESYDTIVFNHCIKHLVVNTPELYSIIEKSQKKIFKTTN